MAARLFEDLPESRLLREALGPGTAILNGFAHGVEAELVSALKAVVERAPLRHMVTPGGFRMSVAMTNCGRLGWVTDRTGYRYDESDPETGFQWPAMPPVFARLAAGAAREAGYSLFLPDACLINLYEPGARLSLHQDKNERDFDQPIVSLRFTVLQIPTNRTCNKRNGVLPIDFTIVSLACSAAVRRSRASSSSFAIASMFCCVGFWASSSGTVLVIRETSKLLAQYGCYSNWGQRARLYIVLALLSFGPDLNGGTNVNVGHFGSRQHLVDLSHGGSHEDLPWDLSVLAIVNSERLVLRSQLGVSQLFT
jgi:DNA alkylation damage repair protein AlkB